MTTGITKVEFEKKFWKKSYVMNVLKYMRYFLMNFIS
jgi:hypothetical protein